MDKMVRITICIEPETEKLIRLLSRRHNRSISELVREAVENHWVRRAGETVGGEDDAQSLASEVPGPGPSHTSPVAVDALTQFQDPAQESS